MNRERSGAGVILTCFVMCGVFLAVVHKQAKKSAQADARLRIILPFNIEKVSAVLENNLEVPADAHALAATALEAPAAVPAVPAEANAAPEKSSDAAPSATPEVPAVSAVSNIVATQHVAPAESPAASATTPEAAPSAAPAPAEQSAPAAPSATAVATTTALSLEGPAPMPAFSLKETPSMVDDEHASSFLDISPIEAAGYLKPLALTHSVEDIARSLKDISAEKALAIVQEIKKDTENGLGRNDILELIFALARHNKADQVQMDALFNFLLDQKLLEQGESVLFVAADKYPDVIMPIVHWYNRYMKRLQDQLNAAQHIFSPMQESALQDAISKNNPKIFKVLLSQAIIPDADVAKRLIERVVQEHKNVQFIHELAQYLGSLNDAIRDNKTILMLAAEKGNLEYVDALIEKGANVNAMLDPKVGTALQLAIIKQLEANEQTDAQRYAQLIDLLRAHGAREEITMPEVPAQQEEMKAPSSDLIKSATSGAII